MSNEMSGRSGWDRLHVLASVLLVVGLGLAGYATYLHFKITGQLQAGHCDGCAPWHPLFILAPLLIGSAFVLGAGYILYRR